MRLEGTVPTQDGPAPLTVGLLKEGESWKVYSISRVSKDGQQGEEDPGHPDRDGQVELVKGAVKQLGLAIYNEDFYRYSSGLLRLQTTVEKLHEAFQAFIDAEVDLSLLQLYDPSIDETNISKNHLMELSGHYDTTTSSRVTYKTTFVHEGFGWKLLGMNINLEPLE